MAMLQQCPQQEDGRTAGCALLNTYTLQIYQLAAGGTVQLEAGKVLVHLGVHLGVVS